MIDDLLLRWIVTALFVISALECGWVLVRHRRLGTHVVGHGLHLVMAVAMAVMAWPAGAALPTGGPALFFLAATAWFVVMVLAQAGHRGVNAYHAAMMLAMSWMYAVMGGTLVPTPADGVVGGGGGGGHHGHHAMPGMDGAHGDSPPFIVGLNWLCTAGFAVATVWWLYRYFAARRADRAVPQTAYFGMLCQAMMAAGMSIMFGVML